MRINCSKLSVVTNEIVCLFYGILPLFKCCVATVIPVSLILMHKWVKCIHKEEGLSSFCNWKG